MDDGPAIFSPDSLCGADEKSIGPQGCAESGFFLVLGFFPDDDAVVMNVDLHRNIRFH